MSQYWIHNDNTKELLNFCINNFTCSNFFVRFIGSYGGKTQVNEDMSNHILSFKLTKKYISFFKDNSLLFKFKINTGYKGFSIEYRENTPFMCPYLYADRNNPNDPIISQNCLSALRNCYENYLLEITFQNKIPLFQNKIVNNNWMLFHIK